MLAPFGERWSSDSGGAQPVALTIFRGMTPLGVLCLQELGTKWWWLGALVTHKDHRKKGMASALMAVVRTTARRLGLTGIAGHSPGGLEGDPWKFMMSLKAARVTGDESWFHDLASARQDDVHGHNDSRASTNGPGLAFIFDLPESSETYSKKVHATMKSVHAYVTRTHPCPDPNPIPAHEPRLIAGPLVDAEGDAAARPDEEDPNFSNPDREPCPSSDPAAAAEGDVAGGHNEAAARSDPAGTNRDQEEPNRNSIGELETGRKRGLVTQDAVVPKKKRKGKGREGQGKKGDSECTVGVPAHRFMDTALVSDDDEDAPDSDDKDFLASDEDQDDMAPMPRNLPSRLGGALNANKK